MLFRWILGVLWLFGGVPGADFLDDALSGHDVAVVGVGEPELLRWRGCCGELDAFWDASVTCRFGEFWDVGLDIEKLINIRELREQTGYAGALSDAWLLGQNPDERYNAMRLATDNAKDLGFAIQVWKPGNESAASKRFGDLYAQSFGGKKLKALATDAFTASHHDVHELGFYDRSKRATVLLSCSSKVCTLAQLQSIALTIQRRL